MISLLDGFSRYNQILVQPEDQAKTAFTTPWGTFMYLNMPFGLMNARATFQRAMNISFATKISDVKISICDTARFSIQSPSSRVF